MVGQNTMRRYYLKNYLKFATVLDVNKGLEKIRFEALKRYETPLSK